MKFRELAWTAFIYPKIAGGGNTAYGRLASDKEFIQRLQTTPSINEFEQLRDFLVHFGVHYTPKNYGEQLLVLWPKVEPHIKALVGHTLENCDLDERLILSNIRGLYDCLAYGAWGGDTVVSKVLHFFNIHLFPMWDIGIGIEYTAQIGSLGYLEFLKAMQQHAVEVTEDFHQLNLQGQPAEFLSYKLGYTFTRPLTKFLDDYNWVTITRNWPQDIPDWLLDLRC